MDAPGAGILSAGADPEPEVVGSVESAGLVVDGVFELSPPHAMQSVEDASKRATIVECKEVIGAPRATGMPLTTTHRENGSVHR